MVAWHYDIVDLEVIQASLRKLQILQAIRIMQYNIARVNYQVWFLDAIFSERKSS